MRPSDLPLHTRLWWAVCATWDYLMYRIARRA